MAVIYRFVAKKPNGVMMSEAEVDIFSKAMTRAVYFDRGDSIQAQVTVTYATPGEPDIGCIEVAVFTDSFGIESGRKEKNDRVNAAFANNAQYSSRFDFMGLERYPIEFSVKPGQTENDKKLEKYQTHPKNIPERFRCDLTGSVMDTPVFCLREPHLGYFEKKHFDLYMSQRPADRQKTIPGSNNTPYHPGDIHVGTATLNDLNAFMEEARQEYLKIGYMFVDLKLPKEAMTTPNRSLYYGQALRNAAMRGRLDFINLILKQHISVDVQDSNPVKKMTALHYAIEKKHFDLAVILIREKNARVDISNATNKTAFDLVKGLEEGVPKTKLLETIKDKYPSIYSERARVGQLI